MADTIDLTSHNQLHTATQAVEADGLIADTYPRWQHDGNGLMAWGTGTAAPDVILQRNTTATLDLTGSLSLNGVAIAATATEINAAAQQSTRIVNCTAATLSLTQALHSGKVVTLNRAAGVTVTLPAATGSGARYTIANGTTVTSNNNIVQVASSTDFMIGTSVNVASTTGGFLTADTGTVATESDTITMNGTTKGGIKGDEIVLTDIAAATWLVRCTLAASGTVATPFSAAV